MAFVEVNKLYCSPSLSYPHAHAPGTILVPASARPGARRGAGASVGGTPGRGLLGAAARGCDVAVSDGLDDADAVAARRAAPAVRVAVGRRAQLWPGPARQLASGLACSGPRRAHRADSGQQRALHLF